MCFRLQLKCYTTEPLRDIYRDLLVESVRQLTCNNLCHWRSSVAFKEELQASRVGSLLLPANESGALAHVFASALCATRIDEQDLRASPPG